jgi:prepilin-type processing-associated H-X9-DG protein
VTRRANFIVAAVVLLLLAGLLLPQILFIREAAKRIQCQNNLKSLGQALDCYQGVNGHYPPGTVVNADLPPDRRLSWHVDLHAFMVGGEKLLLNKDEPWDAEENREPKYSVPKDNNRVEVIGQPTWLTCPSNPNRAAPGTPGLVHYVGVAGVGEDAALLPVKDPWAGVFGYDRKTRPEDIKDGASRTLMVVETDRHNGPWTAGGPATVRGLNPGQPPYLGRSGQFGSGHDRGTKTNALFADGSVRYLWLEGGMSAETFEALATIAGADEVGDY